MNNRINKKINKRNGFKRYINYRVSVITQWSDLIELNGDDILFKATTNSSFKRIITVNIYENSVTFSPATEGDIRVDMLFKNPIFVKCINASVDEINTNIAKYSKELEEEIKRSI